MSEPKHTPGQYLRSGGTVYSLEPDGDGKMRNRWFASVQAGNNVPNDEVFAVARLFEAAPDLLAALRETSAGLVAIGKSRGPVHPLTPPDMVEQQNAALAELLRLINKAQAAIAKAVGGGQDAKAEGR